MNRVWRTTKRFWEDAVDALMKGTGGVPWSSGRLRLSFAGDRRLLGRFHSYYLQTGQGIRLSVVWDEKTDTFVTAENLDRLQVGGATLREAVEEWLNRLPAACAVEEPTGYGNPNRVSGEVSITGREQLPEGYAPIIPLLVEPHTMMLLAPAQSALPIVQRLREKYRKEMGKVRNRLPMDIALVFGSSSTPLRAMLDTGRRMLERPSVHEQEWTLAEDARWEGGSVSLRFGNGQTWHVPCRMGDGQQEDLWYPYYFTAPEGDRSGVGERRASCLAQRLKKDMRVWVTPSWVDWEYLDSAAGRFSIAYSEDGTRRDGARKRRKLYLDELDKVEGIWSRLSEGLHNAQVAALGGGLMDKLEFWDVEARENPDVWRFAAEALLRDLEWKKRPDDKGMEELVEAACSHLLLDCIELHTKILKEDTQVSTDSRKKKEAHVEPAE